MNIFPIILKAYQDNKIDERLSLLKQLDVKKGQKKSKKVYQIYRNCTSGLQTQQAYWKLMVKIAKLDKEIRNLKLDKTKNTTLISCKANAGDSSYRQEGNIQGIKDELSELEQIRNDAKTELLEMLESEAAPVQEGRVGDRFKPGPVGESPVHICFLMGLTDIGKEVIANYYPDRKSLSVAYKNDLLPLQSENAFDKIKEDLSYPENGLYTGETLLHIAIVNEDAASVEYLLGRGIDISSRATGLFFQPRWIRPHVKALSRWQRFLSWIARVDLKVEKFAVVAREVNEYSACYYGEYPLSFAASIGSVQICKLLLSCQISRAENPVESLRKNLSRIGKSRTFVQHNMHWNLNSDGKNRSPQWDFLNAIDFFGNTALHMAVFHRKKDVIDWLMTNEDAKASLEILNFDGFTPLTYAARLGYVDIFNHILFKYLSETGWVYGKVSRYATSKGHLLKRPYFGINHLIPYNT